jgi:peptidoglycan-associated lipoprotein
MVSMTRHSYVMTLMLGALAACGGKAGKAAAVPPPAAPATSLDETPVTTTSAPVPASPSVAVSNDLAKACSLRFGDTQQAPTFGYNDSELLPADRDLLQQLGECLAKGPLHDRNVQLVGRADPRGTEEYNLALGARRADSVRAYLQRLGVAATRLDSTTRGELDASGVDETGWQRDRRVDLMLVQ